MNAAPTNGSPKQAGSAVRRLRRIPLGLRMGLYGAAFLAGVLGGLGSLAYQVDVYLPAWHVEIGWWRLVGVAALAIFLALYVYCSWQLTHRGDGAFVEFDPPSEFVADGPYRWVRNPVASCVLGMVLGEAVALSSTGVLLLFAVGMGLAHLQVIRLEEPLLRKRFGGPYEEYCRRVPRWIPQRPGRNDPPCKGSD